MASPDMIKYRYKAKNLKNEIISGVAYAESIASLKKKLSEDNVFLINAVPCGKKTSSRFQKSLVGRVKSAEIAAFCRQFAVMAASGINTPDILDSLKSQKYSRFFKKILTNVSIDVKSGLSLSTSLAKHKNSLPEFFINMVSVGEESGKAEKVFISLADYYEKNESIKRKTQNAMIYPAFLLTMIFAVIVLLLTFVVPTFKKSLNNLGVNPTGLTNAIYNVSDFLKTNIVLILISLFALVILLALFSKTEKGRYIFDRFKLKSLFLKNIEISLVSYRFSAGLSLLLQSGVDVPKSLEFASKVIGNKFTEEKLKSAVTEIIHGMSITEAFLKYGIFPDIMMQMIAVGEKTASLPETLSRNAAFYNEKFDSALNSFTSKLQPIMLIFMGIAVAVLFIAVYSPMLNLMKDIM